MLAKLICRLPYPVLTVLLMLVATPAFAADDKPKDDVHFSSIFFKLNAEAFVMWLLVIMSIVMVTFAIELGVKMRNAKVAPPAVVALLKDALAAGNYQQAWEICNANPCYLSRVFGAGLERVGRGREAVEGAVFEVSAKESNDLKSHNNYLSVIGVVSPMVGLTGTVLGMMEAFSVLGQEGVANMTGLSTAISTVLIATASGLMVAIPGFVLFYYFKNQAQSVIVYANSVVNLLLEDIPIEQLAGYKVGDAFQAGQAAPGYGTAPAYPAYPQS
jgi:biopolymer transport protein ExbB